MAKKIRVLVLYGGRSSEHEISLLSANSVVRYLDRKRFDVLACVIDKKGRWFLQNPKKFELGEGKALKLQKDGPLVSLDLATASRGKLLRHKGSKFELFDAVFPVMHGPLCEDGSIQGLLDLAGVAYVGSGVLGSAMSRDKVVAKSMASAAGIPVVPFAVANGRTWKQELSNLRLRAQELGYPVFVKPAGQGSSVGVTKVKSPSEFDAALQKAFEFDSKVLIEKGVDAREIEVSVLENRDPSGRPLVSIPGEVAPTHEFYTYEAKYLDPNGAKLSIPAELDGMKRNQFQDYARRVFEALSEEGMARIDFLMDRRSGQIYFNESNTIPGFTSISMYPKMWDASGIPYPDLLSRLVDLAIARKARRDKLKKDFR